ncbi:MAG: hypothetical protein IPM45_03500 [Acidimicrobiales bacterium]|nr:hypothetical protein [Acidimicrobiales bacterium]
MGRGDGDERWSRAFGGAAARSGPGRARDEFEALADEAERRGVAWRDLLGRAYRAPGDRSLGGLAVRFDWRWRAAELRRGLGRDGWSGDEGGGLA